MSIPSYRSAEPVYVISLRNSTQAESQFRNWVKDNKINHAVVNGHKLMLHHQQALDIFMITWRYSWEQIVMWDTWNRRHIHCV
jgi:hypothetical protein